MASQYKCAHCGSHIILNSYWNSISNLYCMVCGTCEEDAEGIISIATGKRVWSRPHDSGVYKGHLKNEGKRI